MQRCIRVQSVLWCWCLVRRVLVLAGSAESGARDRGAAGAVDGVAKVHLSVRRGRAGQRRPLRRRRDEGRRAIAVRARRLQLVWIDRGECGRGGGRRLVPRVASAASVGAPNFHRDSPLGHHFPSDADRREGSGVPLSRGARRSGVLAAVSAVLGSAGQARTELSLLRARRRTRRRNRRARTCRRLRPASRPTTRNTPPAARPP